MTENERLFNEKEVLQRHSMKLEALVLNHLNSKQDTRSLRDSRQTSVQYQLSPSIREDTREYEGMNRDPNEGEKGDMQGQVTDYALRREIEELKIVNSELNSHFYSKDAEIERIKSKLRGIASDNEKLIEENQRKDDMIEGYKKGLARLDFQSFIAYTKREEMNTMDLTMTKDFLSNILRGDDQQDQSNKSKDESGEWQKKYEASMAENSRLIQMIIKGLKESFNDLEKKHRTRCEEIASLYESKIKSLISIRGSHITDKSSQARDSINTWNNINTE